MALQLYIDDSLDGSRKKLFVLAGYLATEEVWDSFSKDWQSNLSKYQLPYFKLSEIFSKHPREIVKSFYEIIEKYRDKLVLVDFILEISLWKKVVDKFPNLQGNKHLKNLLCNPYYISSKSLLKLFFEGIQKFGFQEPIDVIFDDQIGEKDALLSTWDHFKTTLPLINQRIVGKVPAFEDDKIKLPLQAADLIVGYIRKAAENGGVLFELERILPFECKKMKRLAIRVTEEHLNYELNLLSEKVYYYIEQYLNTQPK